MNKVKTTLLFSALSCALLLAVGEASAKCTVTLKFTNNNADAITMLGNDSQARVNGGTWSKMNFNDLTLQPGATDSRSWTTNMSCGGSAKRDLRFKYLDSGNSVKYEELVDNIDIDDGQTYGPYSMKR